jgi:hypothetical protein
MKPGSSGREAVKDRKILDGLATAAAPTYQLPSRRHSPCHMPQNKGSQAQGIWWSAHIIWPSHKEMEEPDYHE